MDNGIDVVPKCDFVARVGWGLSPTISSAGASPAATRGYEREL